MSHIHATALVDPAAQIADDAEIGPFSIIGPKVTIGPGSWIGSHVVVTGRTTIGENTRIFHHTSMGEEPQDKKYDGEDTELIIGDNTTIRELCTFSRGTIQGGGKTIIGNNNWIMACVHIAHDCVLGDNIIMANNASLAGHVTVGDWAILSGYSLIHQFCTVGEHSFTSFASHVNRSIPPYVTVSGEKARARGVNTEGLKRRGYTAEQIQQVRRAYKLLYRSGTPLEEAAETLGEWARDHDEIRPLVDFLDITEKSFIR
ncbi:MAG: acyl-ACP--UDP-N-acetylglucosamine O-acyltransferase [Xanthomonadales bacterium]|jgi:UDP-N-acetylglucosamine acyltransferase|nr:acyl-ACP--UDP-N-acetylglucosamine O-acyltransferase [Xanthomonadales bacterium]MDH3941172.1 acyl-ACP--UDP-N-acetylglucosamine O-acyltransferase [Xanthomonadales bacterium]MDH4001417.1 acyl-ACP--UDP-N-acetylglucosamine O-acyltransferase [Xanthomonadales bacterium]